MQNPEQISDVPLHIMQYHLQQTTVIFQRRSQKMLSEQSSSKIKGNGAWEALTQGRERQEGARRFYEQKCDKTSAAEASFNDTIKDTPGEC